MQRPRRQSVSAVPVWGVPPPPPRQKKYPVLHVVSTKAVELLICSNRLEETATHYVDDRTVFCDDPFGNCSFDHALVGKPRYGSWLAVQQPHVKVVYLLRLTSCALAVEPRLRDKNLDLRGLPFKVWRLTNSEKGEMQCKLVAFEPVSGEVQEAPDVQFCVRRMYCADDRPKGPNAGKWKSLTATAEDLAGRHPQLK